MARRLSYHPLILGLALATTVVDLSTTCAQSTPKDTSAPTAADKPVLEKPKSDQPQDKPADSKDQHDKDQRDPKRADDRHGEKRDGEKRGGGRGDPRRDFWRDLDPDAMLGMLKRYPHFLLEIAKRDGGPLELLAPLMRPEVRQHLGLDAEHSAAIDKFFADLVLHYEQDITTNRNQADVNWEALFHKRLATENTVFREFLSKELTTAQFDSLLGLFVQYRNMRALSNRLITVEKLGMSEADAKQLHEDIETIRTKTLREQNDQARRQFENGNNVQFVEQVNKVRQTMEQRIEKLPNIKKEHLDKLNALRGQEVPQAMLDSLDRPPRPSQK